MTKAKDTTPAEREPRERGGIGCPRCGATLSQVTHTRKYRGFIRRRRICDHCGHAYSTTERVK